MIILFTDDIKNIDLVDHEPEKFIILLHKTFGEYHKKSNKIENTEWDSEDGIKDFFNIGVTKIRTIIHIRNENEDKPSIITKALKFLKSTDNFFHLMFDSKNHAKNKRRSE